MMATSPTSRNEDPREPVVRKYFELVSELRNGKASAVDAPMELWHPDGVFEFAGGPPVVGSFHGAMAVRTLYQNRLRARGMTLESMGDDEKDLRLGVVETKVLKISTSGQRLVVGWRTTVGTAEKRGFDESGSHEFTFQDGKIRRLQVRVGAKPQASELATLSLKDLTVRDIGRLSLAAWPVIA